MRIPRYRLQSQITTQAPGQRITARKRAQPFIQEIEQKAAVQTELFSQAAEYALQQRKIKIEAKKNEAILGGKEAMMELSDRLLDDENPYDIFTDDGKGRWDQNIKDIKTRLRADIGTDRYALADFENAFDQAELSLRFQLKGQIDNKIEKMRVAALDRRNDQFIQEWSNPNSDPSTFDLANATINQMLKQAVNNGGVNPEIVEKVGQENLNKIAKNVIMGYAGTDPDRIFALSTYLDTIDLRVSGDITEEEMIAQLNELPLPNSEWTRIILGSVDRATARDILGDTLTQANRFEAYRKTQNNLADKSSVERLKKLKLLAFSSDTDADKKIKIKDLNDRYETVFLTDFNATIQSFIKGPEEDRYIMGNDLKRALKPFLVDNNMLSISELQNLEAEINADDLGQTMFSRSDNMELVDKLTLDVANEVNSREYLIENKNLLTRETFASFEKEFDDMESAEETELQSALKDINSLVKDEMNFIDRDVLTSSERVSNQSAKKVIGQLKRGVLDKTLKTPDDVFSKANELMNIEKENAKRQLMPFYKTLLVSINQNTYFNGAISNNSTTPLEDLQKRLDELLSQNPNLSGTIDPIFQQFYADINDYVVRGLFE